MYLFNSLGFKPQAIENEGWKQITKRHNLFLGSPYKPFGMTELLACHVEKSERTTSFFMSVV
jgi:hypothetical protein